MKDKKCPSCLAGFSREDVLGNCTCPAPIGRSIKDDNMRSAPLSQTEAFHINDTGEDHPPIHRSESQTERECCAKPNAKEHFEQVLGKCICPCHTQRSDWRERFDQLAKKLRLREETVSGVDEYGLVLNFVSAERENVRRELIELVKELGHQQEDDAIWVNMDEFLTRLKNE